MLYSILIFGSEDQAAGWSAAEHEEVMGRHAQLRAQLSAQRQLGPVMRLSPRDSKVVRRARGQVRVTDGPYAETKEQLMGIYVVECATLEEAVAATELLNFETGVFEIVPLRYLDPGQLAPLIPE
ncbi:MAG TPA: YciI family protein [Povalibacter sp.]|uniref:YciI family protein n=1 Tax=Povalibacter sp. TaxID=1962978 RepID=UPI002C54B8DA|nr:YciI family protein [Povalibacter sp.]HMN46309.1 YciI family protein [Povalibacter sp.]